MKAAFIIAVTMFMLIIPLSLATDYDDAEVYYSFDDDNITGDNPQDISGRNIHGTGQGTLTTGTAGHINEAFTFSGDNANYVTIPSTLISGTDTTWTVNMWIDADVSGRVVFSGTSDNHHLVYLDNATTVSATFDDLDGLADFKFTVPNMLTNAGFHMLTVTCDGTYIRVYWDGTESTTGEKESNGCELEDETLNIGRYQTINGFNYDGIIDEFGIWDYTFSDADVADIYTYTANPYEYAGVLLNSSLRVSAFDNYDNTSISEFTVTLNNGTGFTTTNGTAYLNNFTIGTYYFNVTYEDYFNVTNNVEYTIAALSTTYEKYVYPWASEITFKAYEAVSNASIAGATYYVNGTSGTAPFKLRPMDDYVAMAQKAGYYNKTQTFNVSTFQNETVNIEGMYDLSVLISPRDIVNNNTISGANITLSNSTYSYTQAYNGVTNATFNITTGTYLLTITASNRTAYAENVTFTATGSYPYYAYMYAYNSLWVYAFDADTGVSIPTFNVSVTNGTAGYYGAGSSGVARINLILSGEWEVEVVATGYSASIYTITMTDNSHQDLNAYLSSSTDELLFIFKNRNTNAAIEGVSAVQKRVVNGTLTTVASETSDIAGLVQFIYSGGVTYTFIVSKTGYESRTFTLEPILETYTVLLTPTTTANETVYYDDVIITLDGKLFKDNTTSYYAVTFTSAGGTLEYYNVTWTSDYNSTTASGTNAAGGSVNASAVLSGVGAGSYAKVTVRYKSTVNAGDKVVTYMFAIDGFTPGAGSMSTIRQDLQTLGDLEKVVLATFIMAFIVGIFLLGGAAAGEPLISSAVGGIIGLAICAYIGLMPWGVTFLSFFVLFLILFTRGVRD